MPKKRIKYIDLVKLVTIYLVILGHVIAMMVDGYSVGGRLYSFIYSFHMPLFMILSGFFVGGSVKKPFVFFLIQKTKQLLLPAITCTIIVCIYQCIFRDNYSLRDEIIGNSWFLKTLFIYYILFYILKKIPINDWVLCTCSCVILYIVPMGTTLQINLLFPFFWMGYFFKKYEVLDKCYGKSMYAISFSLLFAFCYYMQLHMNIPNYISINIDTIHTMWNHIIFRYIVAFTGSMTFILWTIILYKYCGTQRIISQLSEYGKWTLGIYVLQTILVVNIFPDVLPLYVGNELLFNVVVAPLLSIVFLYLCIVIIKISSKSRVLDILLYGGQYNHRQD